MVFKRFRTLTRTVGIWTCPASGWFSKTFVSSKALTSPCMSVRGTNTSRQQENENLGFWRHSLKYRYRCTTYWTENRCDSKLSFHKKKLVNSDKEKEWKMSSKRRLLFTWPRRCPLGCFVYLCHRNYMYTPFYYPKARLKNVILAIQLLIWPEAYNRLQLW